jgi:RNA polymerase sigma factor (TIGR02999 family)
MSRSEITTLLRAATEGDRRAFDQLVPLIYDELHAMARGQLRRERSDHSLQPTELVSEAYLRLAEGPGGFENRSHFFGAAATAMRRVLVDHARRRAAEKRGGDRHRVTFEDLAVEAEEPSVDVVALDDALKALEQEDARLARVVEMRFFVGFSIEETATTMGISAATVKRDWTYARAWLMERMGER